MDQISQLMSTHNAAMNAQMSKYTDKLMIGESIARKKDQLLDSAGMELIQAGLGSGRLGKLGSHLLKHALGVNALKHGGAVVDAVRAHQRGGLTGVVSHFATQRPGLAQDVLRGILPNGQADALQSHIRATFANPAAAARALGADHEAGLRARMAAVRASGSSRATSASEEGRSVAERGTAAWRTLKSKGASLFSNATSKLTRGSAAAAAATEKARLAARRVGSTNFADAARDAASSVVDTASSAVSGAADAATSAATSAASSVVDTATSAATSGTAAARGAADRAASLAQGSAGGAAAIAAAARDAAELQARVLQERKEALAKQAGSAAATAGAATKEGLESTTAAVADERERVVRRASEAAQQVTDGARAEGSSVADTMAASLERSQGLGGFANSPEEEAQLRASAAPKESTLPDGGLDRSGNPIPKRKPRPAYRLPAIRRRVVDPVQEKLARTLKVKGIQDRLVKARADYAASQSAASAAAESSRISSWRVPRPSAGPATIRNAALDGGSQLVRSVGSVNSGIDLRRNLSLPTFEEATAAVKSAPQRLLQHLNRRVFGGVAPPSTSANYAASRPKIDFSQELPTLPTVQARAAIVQPEEEDFEPENDGLDYNSLSFENFGFGGGNMEDD